MNIPGGGAALTPEQAIVLVRFLDEINGDIERLNRILTNIANAATFTESKIPLAFYTHKFKSIFIGAVKCEIHS